MQKQNATVNLTREEGKSSVPDGAIAAMMNLSRSVIKQQKAALKKQEEKDDSRLKSWRRMPNVQKNVILCGSVEEDGNIPKEAT